MKTLALLLLLPAAARAGVAPLEPPDAGFFAKELSFQGLPIKASAGVSDEALMAAHGRLYMMLRLLPDAVENLKASAAEFHVIGKDQPVSDLPENRELKGKPFDGAQDVDQRTRGLGGAVASCGEENLLHLDGDRYKGYDVCVHEFAHALHMYGLSPAIKKLISERFAAAKAAGLWEKAYAGKDELEYFAELTMWYFGSRGDVTGLDAEPGPSWLRAYDHEGFLLLEKIYGGAYPIDRRAVALLEPLPSSSEASLRSAAGGAATVTFINRSAAPVQVFWLDGEGKRGQGWLLKPGTRRQFETYEKSAFVAADETGRAVAAWVVPPGESIAAIKPRLSQLD